MTNELQRAESPAATPVEVERTRQRRVFSPRTDIYETEGEVVVLADVPGADEGSVDVTLEENVLTISARTTDPGFEGYRLAYVEFEPGDWQRSFVLSDRVDAARIQAAVRSGQLRVTVPKTVPSQKKIPVLAG